VPVARLSADEFGALLRTSTRDTEEVCRRVLDALSDSPFHWSGELVPISACAGAVPLTSSVDGLTSWLLMAEAACGVAKQFGTGRFHVAREQDPKLIRRQDERHWLSRTQRALATNGFSLMFQRIVPLRPVDDAGSHFELLLRMSDDAGGLISPSSFMPVAERYHLSAAIDRWVVRNAFEWLTSDSSRLNDISVCSLNLSGGTLCDPQFPPFLLEMRKRYGLPASKLCLEITETAAVDDLTHASRVIGDLRDVGFHFALDDFGSGLCSFSYLKHLQVEYLKIDGSFVRQIDSDPISFAMVRSINEIGQVTGKKTVAEFVENEAIARAVRELGMDFAQGYGIHEPEPLKAF
jgi:EAL domain-containing protein (putative c-di-GMP-specific phosphodiesterase class I)